jgi:hypothetical protein
MNENDCQIIEREVCYQGFYRLERLRLRHRLFAGGMSPAIVREVIEKGDVAAVLLYDPTRDEVVMIEQFRIGARNDPRGAMAAGDRRRPDRARRIARPGGAARGPGRGWLYGARSAADQHFLYQSGQDLTAHAPLSGTGGKYRCRRNSRPRARGGRHPRRLPGCRTGAQAWPSRGRPIRPGR